MTAITEALPQDQPSRPKGLTIRGKILGGFGGLLLLMTLSMGITLYKLSAIERNATMAIDERQPAALLLLRMSEELNLATTLLNGYLLTGSEENEKEYLALEKTLQGRMEEATVLTALKGKSAQKQLLEVDTYLARLRDYGSKVIYLRKHPEKNYPGLELARNTLNIPANRFLSLNSLLIRSGEFDFTSPKQQQAYYLLQELRYTWIQMMSNMRLFVSAHGAGDLQDFRIYIEQNGKLLDQLVALDADIGFGELDEMVKTRKEYMSMVPAVVELIQSKAWRADADIMRGEVHPMVERLRRLLKGLADDQLHASIESGRVLTESLVQIRVYAVVLLVLAMLTGVLLAVAITRSIVPQVRRLMAAAREVAEGDLSAEVYIKSNDEIGLLSRSFNAMVNDLRAAALNEQQHTDELKALNQNLEKRVRERTIDLQYSEEKTRAILDNIGEGIITIDQQGRIESINPTAEKMFLYSKQEVIGMNSILFLADEALDNLSDLDVYNDETDGLFRAGESRQPVEYLGKRSDGSTFPMEFVVSAMSLGNKRLRVCIVRDINVRKETEASLAEAQQQLVDAAHKSGMADMATGVLHNIGNILNSVNLAGEEIARIAGASKIQGLLRANAMLSEHRNDLGSFLTTDSKGSKLPGYYLKLGGILEHEIGEIRQEAKSLIEKTTMMKEVIGTQQAYARAGFHSEKLRLEALIDDTLKIQEASLRKWGVKLHKHYTDTPHCLGQKSKLLQVLTNLIKNAQEAMSENDIHNKPKELIIETGVLNAAFAFISIKDNGCGIGDNQLSKIFNHGFTTKREGHGFGLHSSANAMTEMKGSLRVESEGIQQGACFTVTLPIYQTA